MPIPTLFDSPPARKRPRAAAGETRGAAADGIRPLAEDLRAQVLAFIVDRDGQGATDEEVRRGLGLRADTARARRVELRDAGLVRDSGARRPVESGRLAIVWTSTPALISQEILAPVRPDAATGSSVPADWPEHYPCAEVWGRERRK